VLRYFAVARNWTAAQTLAHTMPQLIDLVRGDRAARGEPEDGAVASATEQRRWMRKVAEGRV
jgi:hypothetical protein